MVSYLARYCLNSECSNIVRNVLYNTSICCCIHTQSSGCHPPLIYRRAVCTIYAKLGFSLCDIIILLHNPFFSPCSHTPYKIWPILKNNYLLQRSIPQTSITNTYIIVSEVASLYPKPTRPWNLKHLYCIINIFYFQNIIVQ